MIEYYSQPDIHANHANYLQQDCLIAKRATGLSLEIMLDEWIAKFNQPYKFVGNTRIKETKGAWLKWQI